MKKIYTILLILLATTGYGQSTLKLIFNDQAYENNDSVTINVENPRGDNDYYIDVVNLSGDTVNVSVLKTEIAIVSGTMNVFCFGDQCYSGNTTMFPVTILAGDTFSHANYPEDAFHIIYTPDNNMGTSTIKYTFFDEEIAGASVSLIINYVTFVSVPNYNAGFAMSAYPNPASTNVTIVYDLGKNNNNSAVLTIKSLMGATIFSEKLLQNSNKISVNLSDFSPGVYFYSIENGGKTISTKKLLIK